MTRIYVIFSIVGWAWALIVGVFLFVRIRRVGIAHLRPKMGDAHPTPPPEPSRDP